MQYRPDAGAHLVPWHSRQPPIGERELAELLGRVFSGIVRYCLDSKRRVAALLSAARRWQRLCSLMTARTHARQRAGIGVVIYYRGISMWGGAGG